MPRKEQPRLLPKQSYRVSGVCAVLGHKPGEEFEAELTEAMAARLIESGALAPADKQPGPGPDGEPEAADENKE
jgi:hypothetical protein